MLVFIKGSDNINPLKKLKTKCGYIDSGTRVYLKRNKMRGKIKINSKREIDR